MLTREPLTNVVLALPVKSRSIQIAMEAPFPAYDGDDPYIFVSYAHEDVTEVYPDLRWLREHMIITSKHLPDRAPLPDKGKPAVRRGRKATGQISDLAAGLPEEE